MENTIKECFKVYYNNLKNVIKSDTIYEIDNMSIMDIDNEIDMIHMKYIMTSTYSVSKSCIQCVGYNHLKSVIEQYYERMGFYEDNKKWSM